MKGDGLGIDLATKCHIARDVDGWNKAVVEAAGQQADFAIDMRPVSDMADCVQIKQHRGQQEADRQRHVDPGLAVSVAARGGNRWS